MKLSLIASSAMIGLGLVSNVGAKNIYLPNEGDLKNYFDIYTNSDSTHLSIKNIYKNEDLKIQSNVNDFVVGSFPKYNTFTHIDLGDNNLTIENIRDSEFTDTASRMYNANLSASNINLRDMSLEYYKNANSINANVNISNSNEPQPNSLNSSIMIINSISNDNFNASLNITGSLDANKTKFYGASTNGNLNFNVGKKANIANSKFFVLNRDLNNLTLNKFLFMSAESFNPDITTRNTAGASIFKRIDEIFSPELAAKFQSATNGNYLKPMDLKDLVEYKLSVEKDGNKEYLIISGSPTQKINSIKAILETEKEYLNNIIKEYDLEVNANLSPIVKKDLENLKTQIANKDNLITKINSNGGDETKLSTQEKMDAMGIEITQTSKYIFEKVSNLKTAHSNGYKLLLTTGITGGAINTKKVADSMQTSGNIDDSQNIFNSLIASNIDPSIGVKAITDGNFFKDVIDNSKSSTNILNNGSYINSAINISNDMSISKRVATINNPYNEIKFANALASNPLANNDNIVSDAMINYYGISGYGHTFWANTFGGVNIIDGQNGGLYGISVGMDRQLSDALLFGFYLTYANSNIKDKINEQKSNNYQTGIYGSFRFDSYEINSKFYAQIADTDQTITLAQNQVSANFNRKFAGFSSNIGKVFRVSSDLFLKPFVGANYYYSYTPNYTERGALSQKVRSNTNNSVSLELGLESKKYFNENSYLFISPKIEQYIINNGDDYTANFIGSNAPFSIKGNDKKKSYGQLIIGGNIALNDRLNLDAGIGAKQILTGKVDSKNETYLSGNIDIKYKF